jgi:hypothetical protein
MAATRKQRKSGQHRQAAQASGRAGLAPDLQHDLASGVPACDARQRHADLIQREHRIHLRAQPAGIDQAAECLKLLPGYVRAERLTGDAALQLGGRTRQDYEDRPAAVAHRAECLVAGLAAGAVEKQVDAAGNRSAHLLGPVGSVVVKHLTGAEARR